MTSFKFIIFFIASALFLNGCQEILEPVSFFGDKQDLTMETEQEEFEINIKSLTFNTAKKANYAEYPRRLIFTGSGSNANIFDEADFLKSTFPNPSKDSNYLIGIGDQISFNHVVEFKTKLAQWPKTAKKTEYLLGAGDELTFTQSNDNSVDVSISYSESGQLIPKKNNDSLISTTGVIGSNGNILLYGLGNILATNRTLDDVRTEVRNILIRNGLAPNFQLEISNFQSQKVYLASNNNDGKIYPLNNLPMTLRQLLLISGLSKSNENFAEIYLTRNDEQFRFTPRQLFDLQAPEIILQNNDQISIKIAPRQSKNIINTVGPKGNILLEEIGSISVENRTLDSIHKEITNILIGKGIKPNFQLELTNFFSKKAYLIDKDKNSTIVTLTDTKITLRELMLKNNPSKTSENSLSIITLKRNGKVFRMTLDKILDPQTQDIWIMNEDQIEVESLFYKPGQVFALSGAGRAQLVSIDPSKRETLADILFVKDGVLNNLKAKRSEVYLLRGENPSIAYHLDTQNVSRILVAAKTELRPNDIIYVADRPIISFSRTLSEILPLRILLRDIKNDKIP